MTSASHFCVFRRLQRWSVLGCAGLMTACAGGGPVESVANQDVEWVATSVAGGSSAKWQHSIFPGKPSTRYHATRLDGRKVIQSDSKSAASMLRQNVRVEPAELGKLRFSWKVPELITGADLSQRDADDSPVRVVLAFEGDRSKFSAKNAMLSELSLALTGEALPYATLMYVWGNHRAAGSVIINPRTDRIRKLVVESGPQQLDRWLDYERDISADYEKAFGEAPGALLGIGIMTDTDNTRQQTRAWYGPLMLLARPVDSAAGLASAAAFRKP